ncbi:uncharacterized protein LOC112015993 [Quercus suber]|uniref:uncharacterized protein LOC112015993 n=1 Tax=Quercus suber TaxID=58331 RepID=UPI000CE28635|nr:uncharacterized protein LOC112015993 [Quercus suber]
MEDLTKSWSCLTLSKTEGVDLQLTEDQAEVELIVATKFLTKRALNIETIVKTFTPLWRTKNGFNVKREGDHIVLFTFDDKSEMEKILTIELWSFNKHLVVLQRYDRETNLTDMEFNKVTFWVQVHDIPIRFRNKRVAARICSSIGTVNETRDDLGIEGDGFKRTRVTIDISKSLSCGRVITLKNGMELWVSFKYKRLPNICYWCGCLTHGDYDYEQWIESKGNLLIESQQYGPWICAAPFTPS